MLTVIGGTLPFHEIVNGVMISDKTTARATVVLRLDIWLSEPPPQPLVEAVQRIDFEVEIKRFNNDSLQERRGDGGRGRGGR